MMRVVLLGSIDFTEHCFKVLLDNQATVVAVVTLSPENGSFHSDYADLRPVAKKYGIPVYHINHISEPENIELIRSLNPDVLFVFGWSQLLPKEVIDIPEISCIGSHPAMLPRNRGRHPLVWALVNGWCSSGLTFFHIDQGADSGDILWQEPFIIDDDDDAACLYDKIKGLATKAISEFLPQLESGTYPRIPQNDKDANYLRKRGMKDGEINWEIPANRIHNLVRGLSKPYVGAHTYLLRSKVVIWKTRILSNLPGSCGPLRPGTVVLKDGLTLVSTGSGVLELVNYESCDNITLKSNSVLGSYQ